MEETALKRIKAGEDSVAVAKDTLKKAKAIPLPIDKKFVYEDVISEYAISRTQSPKRKGGELVPLSLEDVVAGGAEVAAATKRIRSSCSRYPCISDQVYDTVLWTYPGFDYNHSIEDLAYLAEQLHDFFYFQNVPETQEKIQYDAIFGYAEYARRVRRWLQESIYTLTRKRQREPLLSLSLLFITAWVFVLNKLINTLKGLQCLKSRLTDNPSFMKT